VTEPSKQSGSDPVGDLQRWLVRSGARSVTRQLSGQIRTALGGRKPSTSDVWEAATSDYDESPECAWCPICRARRRLRESGLGAGVSAAADAVGVVMQDAMSAFEAAVSAAGRPARPRDTAAQPPGETAAPGDTRAQPPGEVWDEATDEPAVRTRPPANGSASRPAGSRPRSAAWPQPPAAAPTQPPAAAPTQPPAAAPTQPPAAAPTQPPAEAKQPSPGSKQPSPEAKPSSAEPMQSSGGAKKPSGGAKKPAAGARKPAAQSGGPAAADGTPPDKPTAAKPDDPTG
jgi:hypothetical protein